MRKTVFSTALGLLLLLWQQVAPACADWINLTGAETAPNIAEITVLEERVNVRLEIYIGNLEVFSDLIPDRLLKEGVQGRPPLTKRLKHFAAKVFRVLGPYGKALPAEVKLIEPRVRVDRKSPFAGMINPLTRQRIRGAPADKRVLFAEIDYLFEGKPESLTISPPLDKKGNALVSIGFIAYHKAVPIIDFRHLGAGARVKLDWQDPWYTAFENPRLTRHHSSALMSFLYIEANEVRHEVLARITDLKTWMDLGLRGNRYIETDEWESLKQRLGKFIASKNPLSIDGKLAKPIIDRINFVRLSLRGIQVMEAPERLDQSTAIVGVILAFIVPGLPQKVSVNWELFSDQIKKIPTIATDPAGPFRSFVVPNDNKHEWQNFLKNYSPPTIAEIKIAPELRSVFLPIPTLGLLAAAALAMLFGLRTSLGKERSRLRAMAPAIALLIAGVVMMPFGHFQIVNPIAGTPVPAAEQANPVVKNILANIYRAFDFRREENVYDKLALTVAGDQLTEIYLQNRQAMVLQKQGGARARVQSVKVTGVDNVRPLDDGKGFRVRARWSVQGSVGHWGHVHQRRNLYEAELSISEVAGLWKLSKFDLIEEKRMKPAVSGAAR